MIIDKLDQHYITKRDGGYICVTGTREPNNAELREKINEIIDVINYIAETKDISIDDILKYKNNVKET